MKWKAEMVKQGRSERQTVMRKRTKKARGGETKKRGRVLRKQRNRK